MAELITKDQVIEWFRCYGHMDKPIPYDVLVMDIQAMDTVDAANLQQNNNCAAIAQQWIPVTERLPSKSGHYAVIDGEYMSVLSYSSRYKRFNLFDDLDPEFADLYAITPTHWMPLPELPKEVPENETL